MGVRIHLIRHGQIRANVKGLWHGSTDSPLTWRGKRQAKRTGKHLANADTPFAAVYSSPLQRCIHTAQFATAHLDLEVIPTPGLAEMSIGEWEGESFSWLRSEHNFVRTMTKNEDYAAPGGESLKQVSTRVCDALRGIDASHSEDDHVLVTSHGVAIAVALATLLDESPGKWVNYHFDNCSITEIEMSPEPVVYGYNQTGHL